MSFFSNWQPLRDEDAHTALIFGFLRHAPRQAALDVWLSRTLGRPVSTAVPLTVSSFWPSLASVVLGTSTTIPELVLIADDGEPLVVFVEVKPGYGMHTIEQIMRETVDVASAWKAKRVACVMVAADLSRPVSSDGWEKHVAAAVREHLPTPVSTELHYSSFAALGQVIADCGRNSPEWTRYAEDVTAQLRRKGLLGYEGAPMLDDLDGLTMANAVEVFNRAIRAARQFYLQLHAQQGFLELGLEPHYRSYRMLRDGRSDVVTESEIWFVTTVALSLYKHSEIPAQERVFVSFDLLGSGSGHADLLVGRVSFTNEEALGPGRFGQAVRESQQAEAGSPWTEIASSAGAEWVYDRRPWLPEQRGEDIEWAIARLAATVGSMS